MTVEEVMDKVEGDRVFYENSGGGVTFSGGEPIAQFEFLSSLLEESGQRGLHRTLETNGHIAWEKFAKLLSNLELVLFDLKHLDSQIHKQYVGAGNRLIIANLKKLAQQDRVGWIVRMPFIPGINSELVYVESLGQWLKNLGAKEIHLLPYHRLGNTKRSELGDSRVKSIQKIEVPSEEQLEIATNILKTKKLSVVIGG
jgi:pyruvate formate lyase activating enzyme